MNNYPEDIISIRHGNNNAVLLGENGSVWEWDLAYNLQQVVGLSDAIWVSAGDTLGPCAAVLEDGTLWIWGGYSNLPLQQIIFP